MKRMKTLVCPNCKGRGYDKPGDTYGHTCQKCFGQGTITRPKMQIDDVRELSDENVAILIGNAYLQGYEDHMAGKGMKLNYSDWLFEEVEE